MLRIHLCLYNIDILHQSIERSILYHFGIDFKITDISTHVMHWVFIEIEKGNILFSYYSRLVKANIGVYQTLIENHWGNLYVYLYTDRSIFMRISFCLIKWDLLSQWKKVNFYYTDRFGVYGGYINASVYKTLHNITSHNII